MQNTPFYIGQEVVALHTMRSTVSDAHITKGEHYTVRGLIECKCGASIDVGQTVDPEIGNCLCGHIRNVSICWIYAKNFAPVERARTKYVVKEVEVVPAIREMEKCLS